MFQVTINDQVYKVVFRHEFFQDCLPDHPFYNTEYKCQTICNITSKENPHIYSNGVGFCSIKDQFNKNKGRKIALMRALQGLTPDKTVREFFWLQYFAKHGGY